MTRTDLRQNDMQVCLVYVPNT